MGDGINDGWPLAHAPDKELTVEEWRKLLGAHVRLGLSKDAEIARLRSALEERGDAVLRAALAEAAVERLTREREEALQDGRTVAIAARQYQSDLAAARADVARLTRGTEEVARVLAAARAEAGALRTLLDTVSKRIAEFQAKVTAAKHDGGKECSYCHGVGACPRCWGRAGIERADADAALPRGRRLHRNRQDARPGIPGPRPRGGRQAVTRAFALVCYTAAAVSLGCAITQGDWPWAAAFGVMLIPGFAAFFHAAGGKHGG